MRAKIAMRKSPLGTIFKTKNLFNKHCVIIFLRLKANKFFLSIRNCQVKENIAGHLCLHLSARHSQQKMSKETAKNILACKIRFYTLIRGLLEAVSIGGIHFSAQLPSTQLLFHKKVLTRVSFFQSHV